MPKVSSLSKGPPLGFAPSGASSIATGVDLTESDDGSGAVFLWGMASWCWSAGDVAARRLAAVQLAATNAATAREVAAGFGIKEPTLWRWSDAYRRAGVSGLMAKKKGPKGPSKLNAERTAEIARLRAEGLSLRAIGTRVGVSHDSVLRALGPNSASGLFPDQQRGGDLVPLALPKDRSAEREAAHRGMLAEAAPVITEGASLPLAGALTILPALGATGLIDAASSVYGTGRVVGGTTRAAFYGLRSLVLAVVFSALVGEPRAEGLTRIDPVSIGRLLGLDRAPEVSRLRFRMAELAGAHKADELVMALARRHTATRAEAVGLLYVDGHVRAYHGKEEIPKAHVARMRIAMPAEVDTWICDRFGDGLLVWQAAPGASLVGELQLVTDKIRRLVGPDARPTIAFDRGGWSPKLFGGLETAGFDILTYRKAPLPREPRGAFAPYDFTDELGRSHHYLLADRRVAISYDAKRRRFACRQITRLDEATGHQTQILTTRDDTDPSLLAHAMFSRWRQENFFRYLRHNLGLDALDSYAKDQDDLARSVPNPKKKDAANAVRAAKAALVAAEAEVARTTLQQGSAGIEGIEQAHEALAATKAAQRAVPARVALGEVYPDAMRLSPERKRLHDAIRMATYNATTALCRLLAPHYPRAEDEGRTLLLEALRSPADLAVIGDELHVHINALSAPRRSRAIAGLCAELNATETLYPGTTLRLVFAVKGF